jgi:hypothetical protein
VAFGGTFSDNYCTNENLQQHNGIVHGDIDGLLTLEATQELKARLCQDAYVV